MREENVPKEKSHAQIEHLVIQWHIAEVDQLQGRPNGIVRLKHQQRKQPCTASEVGKHPRSFSIAALGWSEGFSKMEFPEKKRIWQIGTNTNWSIIIFLTTRAVPVDFTIPSNALYLDNKWSTTKPKV